MIMVVVDAILVQVGPSLSHVGRVRWETNDMNSSVYTHAKASKENVSLVVQVNPGSLGGQITVGEFPVSIKKQ